MDVLWDTGRKAGVCECKFRRRGKTLCALYVKDDSFGVVVIFGASEQEKFEEHR